MVRRTQFFKDTHYRDTPAKRCERPQQKHTQSMDGRQAATLTISITAGAATLILLITCGLAMNWWPMLSLIVYPLMMIPVLLTTIKNDEEDINFWEQFGFCSGGFVLSSLFGIPLILARFGSLNELNRTTLELSDNIDTGLVAGCSIANIIIFAGILAFAYIAKRDE